MLAYWVDFGYLRQVHRLLLYLRLDTDLTYLYRIINNWDSYVISERLGLIKEPMPLFWIDLSELFYGDLAVHVLIKEVKDHNALVLWDVHVQDVQAKLELIQRDVSAAVYIEEPEGSFYILIFLF